MFCFGWFRYTDMSFSTQSWRQSFQTSVMFHENYYMSLPPRRSFLCIFWHFVVFTIWSMFSLQMWGMVLVTMIWTSLHTLLGTNISPTKSVLKMIFIFPKRDMLRIVPWRVAGSVCGIVTSQFWYHLLDPEVSPARPGLAARSNSKSLRDYGSVRHGELWLLGSTKKAVVNIFHREVLAKARGFPGSF